MQVQFDAGATRWRRRVSACVGLLAFALVLALAGTSASQSVLGTIRGTVTDAGGGVIPKAPVLITDETTGLPRTVDTDARGVFEVANLQPGTYRVEVIVTKFKKYERPGIVVRTGQASLVDVQLEIGPIGESVNVTAAAPANIITLDNPSVIKGLDEQQLRDLPRGSRDIQSFLYLNPNVAGSDDQIQFLGGRTYGVSYIQDGQTSTNAIFGTVGNSAPGLDSIQEMQVLSNSYSAEYGGLAGVVVTTKRGGQQFHGSMFYDFNSNELNALTYGQKLTGATRNDPNADTKVQRYGGSFGGPLFSKRTFFFGSYEGLRDKTIQGGGNITLPNAALRAGDFSQSTIKIKDPTTGLPFPGNVIPDNRISPVTKNLMNYFWPLPNRSILATGMGTFQQYVPVPRKRERFDMRVDHEAGAANQFFGRASYQYRNPTQNQFEAGSALTNLPLVQSALNTYTAVGGWTSILTNKLVNEMRLGYNYDGSNRKSNWLATQVAANMGFEAAPSIGPDVPGFPSLSFSGSNRPGNLSDQGRNNNRNIQQNSFSFADNLSWMTGEHSIRSGVLVARNSAIDGFGRGLNHRGRYNFNGSKTGNSFADFLLGLPFRVDEHVSTRGDLNGHSWDFAGFMQDDWRVNQKLTLFLGLRYELAGMWNEKNLMLANFQAVNGGYHVVANKDVWAKLPPGLSDPSSPWYSHVKLASDVGLPNTLVNADKNNFSPRIGYAYRVDTQGKTVLRGGFGLFHPTTAIQGIRDQLAANEFRYTIQRTPGPFAHAFSQGTGIASNDDFGTQGVWPNIQSPDIYQYNLTLERELPWALGFRASYLGSTMRNLLVNREYNSIKASTEFMDNSDPAYNYRRPFPMYGAYVNMIENTGSGRFDAGQFEVTRRFRKGFAFDIAYTLAHSDGNAPDSGNASLGVIQYDPYNIEADRGPDPFVVKHRVVANATLDVPVGRGRPYASSMPGWAEALFGGWTVSTIFQARSGANLTPYFLLSSTSTPYNIGFSPDTTGVWTGPAFRPDQVSNPMASVPAGMFFNPAAYAVPADGVFPGSTKRNSLVGPHNWIVNLAFYKDIVSTGNLKVQFTCMLDNAFNTAQFFPGPGSEFLDLTDYLVNGNPPGDNGTTAVLGSTAEANVEGFALSRQIRLGIRARF